MGHSLNMKVIAEGVETKKQLDFLKRHQCDEIQGFYVSQGIVAEKIPKLLSDFSKKKNELMGKS
jgi:EAL domain-containing protein (putative c-di-GMP-specific phosphodiesterase class I)